MLVRAWRRWEGIAAGGRPEAYLRRALFTTYLSWWRRRWRAEVPAAVPESARTGNLADESANRDAVRRALARLSRQQRAIVVLRYVEDLSVERTAELAGCSPATVRVQALRALRTLRTDPHLRLEEVGS